jgi:hypothetical protein
VSLFKKAEIRKRNKIAMCVTVSPDLAEWLDYNIQVKAFASRSHGIEYCLSRVKKDLEK